MSLDKRDWVEAAYRLILGRDPDPEGLRLHLNAGLSPEALAKTFLHSAEFQAKQLSPTTNAGIRQLKAGLGVEIIATQRIDTILGDRRVDLMKIDIEGHEYKAMLGAHQLLSKHRPVIISEYSPEFQNVSSGVDGATYIRHLLNYGYRLSVLPGGPKQIDPAELDAEWEKGAAGYLDVLFEPDRRDN